MPNNDYLKLRECPFCGFINPELYGITIKEYNFRDYVVICSASIGGCGASTGHYAKESEAIEAWNRRADHE